MKRKRVIMIKILCAMLVAIPSICHAANMQNQNVGNISISSSNDLMTSGKVGIAGNNTNLSVLNLNAQPLVRATVLYGNSEFQCTGTLVSNTQIVTAAHCLRMDGEISFYPGSMITINYMDQYQNNTTIMHQLRDTVNNINIYSSYLTNHCDILPQNTETARLCTDNDSAVITLNSPLPANAAILPTSVGNNPYGNGLIDYYSNVKPGSVLLIVGTGSGVIKYSTTKATTVTIRPDIAFGGAWKAIDPLLIADDGDSGGPLYICTNTYTDCTLMGLVSRGTSSITSFADLSLWPSF